MKKNLASITSVLIISVLLLSACSGVGVALSNAASQFTSTQTATGPATTNPSTSGSVASTSATTANTTTNTTPAQITANSGLLSAFESTLESIYSMVSPQVVMINVVTPSSGSSQNFPGFNNQNQGQQVSQALGSGFIWDTNGNIVTNDHVVNGASNIEVVFSDGQTFAAKVVGEDPFSDLAVINVSGAPASLLKPITLADSSTIKVGQLAIAIGNPFGFTESMTMGTISGIGRDIPNSNGSQSSTGATYSIPDVIQTDAAINPGNSGGVLVNDQGQVLGVTYSLESSSGSSSGIGFAIPSQIVNKVVPQLISKGTYAHPYLGISGTDITPDIAKAMNLPTDTRGALIVQVVPGGPAANAGLKGSSTTVTINGVQGEVGGDVITAINGSAITSMSDLITYLELNTSVGQSVSLSIIRNGHTQTVNLTLGTRPSQ